MAKRQGTGETGTAVVVAPPARALPPVLAGWESAGAAEGVRDFYAQVAVIFEAWVTRRESPHTQRAYRDDVMTFVRFMGWTWPGDAPRLLQVSIRDVLAFREALLAKGAAAKTLNRRVSSLSSFYKYLAGAAAEFRLPITVPNPAHAQFIARSASDPRKETRALSSTRARQLMNMPSGDSVVEARDRAILRTFLYTGVRLGTLCRLEVRDFHDDEGEATLRLQEKGGKRRTIGIHFATAQAIHEYLEKAGVSSGPLFRARKSSQSEELSGRAMDSVTAWRVVCAYLDRLPGAVHEVEEDDGTTRQERVYTPHSLRATTATLLLDAGVDITKVQGLLGHRHLTTTQIYDKRRRSHKESASHDVPI
jgi:integrase/recombinase XerC